MSSYVLDVFVIYQHTVFYFSLGRFGNCQVWEGLGVFMDKIDVCCK